MSEDKAEQLERIKTQQEALYIERQLLRTEIADRNSKLVKLKEQLIQLDKQKNELHEATLADFANDDSIITNGWLKRMGWEPDVTTPFLFYWLDRFQLDSSGFDHCCDLVTLEGNDPICKLRTKDQMVRFMQAITLSEQDKTT